MTGVTLDRSSLSNPHQVVVTHLDWTAHVEFKTSIISATASFKVKRKDPACSTLTLDTNKLYLISIRVEGEEVGYAFMRNTKGHLGRGLVIDLPKEEFKELTVEIKYTTTADCSAVQWLPPAQTAGKIHPYLFTQCQAIHARSLLPCQDCPGVKMTYCARVTVPKWATAVMSAISLKKFESSDVEHVFEFEQRVPVPSYLFALAVGELESVDISKRVRIWSEPSVVQSAAYEFAQTEDFLQAAEELTGVLYAWRRYDLLCLPPSFPYGGMENPCLTFVTPTLLAGDRSLADVVAHEIAHSWTGNLVTNSTWEHFWLNEGWTTWLQRKIMARIHKNPKFFDFDAIGGWKHLEDDVALMPPNYQRLVPELGDQDPDEAFSSVPYEKGFNLLYALDRQVGTAAFEAFFKDYVKLFEYRTVSSNEFRDFFKSKFPSAKVDWDEWFYAPGMPAEKPSFDRTLSQGSEKLAQAWERYDTGSGTTPTESMDGWSSNQKTCFLDALKAICDTRGRPLSVRTIAVMKEQYELAESKNSEILFRFCLLAVESGDETILSVVVRFITTQGRMKFVRPLYRALFASEMGKEVAAETFLASKSLYHPICAKMLAADLQLLHGNKKRGGALLLPSTLLVGAAAVALVAFLLRRKP